MWVVYSYVSKAPLVDSLCFLSMNAFICHRLVDTGSGSRSCRNKTTHVISVRVRARTCHKCPFFSILPTYFPTDSWVNYRLKYMVRILKHLWRVGSVDYRSRKPFRKTYSVLNKKYDLNRIFKQNPFSFLSLFLRNQRSAKKRLFLILVKKLSRNT